MRKKKRPRDVEAFGHFAFRVMKAYMRRLKEEENFHHLATAQTLLKRYRHELRTCALELVAQGKGENAWAAEACGMTERGWYKFKERQLTKTNTNV